MAAETLEFVAMDIWGPLSNIAFGNQEMIFMTDWHPKLTKAISATTETFKYATTVFWDNWVILYEISTFRWPKLTTVCVKTLCGSYRPSGR